MKKSLNKVIVTLAAVTALTAAMAITASAASTAPTVTATQDTVGGKTTITANVTAVANEQVTMLVLKPTANAKDGISEDEIAYIDQKAADGEGKVTFTMPIGTTKENEKYELLSGSTSATEASTGEVVIPGASEKTHYGDVTGEGDIDTDDALEALYYFVGKNGEIAKFTDDAGALLATPVVNDAKFACADVTGEGDVDTDDALEMLYHFVGKTSVIDDSWMN